MKQIIFTFFIVMFCLSLKSQQVLTLYSNNIPNSRQYQLKEIDIEANGQLLGYRDVSNPTLSIYLPKKEMANGTAVIICPGGGTKWNLSFMKER